MSEDIREQARKRLKAKRDFWTMLLIFIAILIGLNVIWLLSGPQTYYWPVWPMLGFAIATVATAVSVFGPGSRPISEAAIDEEIRKMGGDR